MMVLSIDQNRQERIMVMESLVSFLLDLIVTVCLYLLVPAIYCIRKQKLPISKIKRIAIVNGACVWLFFSIVRASAGIEGTSAAVFMWSAVGYLLMKKYCLVNSEKNDDTVVLRDDSFATQPQIVHEPVVTPPRQPVPAKMPPVTKRYCQFCGSPVDNATKRCQGCGKQYFHFKRSTLFVTAIIASLVATIVVMGIIWDYSGSYSLDRPESGSIFFGSSAGTNTITVTVCAPEDCLVVLKNYAGDEKLSFYIRSGDTTTINVPDDAYRVHFITGTKWQGYGKEKMFGKDANYSMHKSYILCDGNTSWEFDVYPVTDSRFSETPIDEDEFFD